MNRTSSLAIAAFRRRHFGTYLRGRCIRLMRRNGARRYVSVTRRLMERTA
jgi:hypothetical protein